MARLGYLYLHDGRWGARQLLPESWVAMARTPGPVNPDYGFMNFFLNTDRRLLPSAPESAVVFIGNGMNAVVVDWDHDVVVVVRWIRDGRALDAVVAQVLAALPDG